MMKHTSRISWKTTTTMRRKIINCNNNWENILFSFSLPDDSTHLLRSSFFAIARDSERFSFFPPLFLRFHQSTNENMCAEKDFHLLSKEAEMWKRKIEDEDKKNKSCEKSRKNFSERKREKFQRNIFRIFFVRLQSSATFGNDQEFCWVSRGGELAYKLLFQLSRRAVQAKWKFSRQKPLQVLGLRRISMRCALWIVEIFHLFLIVT